MSVTSSPPRTRTHARRRVIPAAVVAAIVAPLAVLAIGAQPALAAPAAPTVIFEEDFESGGSTTATSLDTYVGVDGVEYSSNPFWVDVTACNGVILQSLDTVFAPGWCGDTGDARLYVRALSEALGTQNGSPTPDTNHSVTAYTNASGGAGDNEMLRSEAPIATLQAGHFYALSVAVAEVNCTVGQTQSSLELGLGLTDGDTILNSTPIQACFQGGARTINVDGNDVEARIGTFFTPGYLATTTGDASVFLRNQATDGSGNDMAYDTLRLLDVTPSVEKSFSDETVEVGMPTTLTFTVTNTTDLQEKAGWSFTDELPAGMVVAPTPNLADGCGADLTATSGGSSVTIADGTIGAGVETCQISVDVVLEAGGDFANVIEGAMGLTGTPSAAIRGIVPSIAIEKAASAEAITFSGQTVDYTFTVTNDGEVPLSSILITDTGPVGGHGTMSAIDCAGQTALEIGESMTCTSTYTSVSADLTGEPLTNSAKVGGISPAGQRISDESSVEVGTAPAAPALALVKTASTDSLTRAGQTVEYRFAITNIGNVEIADVAVAEGSFNGHGTLSEIVCPADEAVLLAPAAEMTCTATYTVAAADLNEDQITNTATAVGVGTDGSPIASAPSTATLATPDAPALGSLAITGAETPMGIALGAGLIVLLGAGLFAATRQRRNS